MYYMRSVPRSSGHSPERSVFPGAGSRPEKPLWRRRSGRQRKNCALTAAGLKSWVRSMIPSGRAPFRFLPTLPFSTIMRGRGPARKWMRCLPSLWTGSLQMIRRSTGSTLRGRCLRTFPTNMSPAAVITAGGNSFIRFLFIRACRRIFHFLKCRAHRKCLFSGESQPV